MDVSIVVPVLREREAGLDGLEHWVRQSAGERRVEIVAVSPGGQEERDALVRSILRSSDRLLVVPGAGEAHLWDAGARASAGEVVVLVECHCIPQPGCLEAAMRALDGGLDVACFESFAPSLTAAAWVEDTMFQRLFERYADSGDPRALSLRGVALRRSVYLASGGVHPSDHECFAERAFAARLANAGAVIGRAPGALVEHVPNTTFSSVRADSLAFHRDEIRARSRSGGSEIDPDAHLEYLPEWGTRGRLERKLNRAALRALIRLGAHRDPPARAARRETLGTVLAAVGGLRGAAVLTSIRCRWQQARFQLSWRLGRRPDPAPLWTEIARGSVLRVLSERRDDGLDGVEPLELPANGQVRSADALGRHAVGLHDVERYGERQFRWTRPSVTIAITPPPGATAVTIAHLGIRPLLASDVRAAWGPDEIPPSALTFADDSIVIPVPPRPRGSLTVAFTEFVSAGDVRRLGVPLTGIAASRAA